MREPAARKNSRSLWAMVFFAGVLTVVMASFVVKQLGRVISTSAFLSHSWATTLVVHSDPLVLLVLTHESDDKHQIIIVPNNLIAEVPFGYGPYPFEKVWQLAHLEKKSLLPVETATDLFHVHVDGYISSDQLLELSDAKDHPIIQKLQNQLGLSKLLRRVDTNLPFLDRLIAWWNISSLRSSNTTIYDLRNQPFLFQTADHSVGVQGVVSNELLLTQLLSDHFENVEARSDSLSVRVYNTTDVSGLGQLFSQFVSTFGGKVIAVENKSQKVPICQVVTNTANVTKILVRYVVSSFGCSIQAVNGSLDADMYVLVGDAYANRWK